MPKLDKQVQFKHWRQSIRWKLSSLHIEILKVKVDESKLHEEA